MTSNEVAPNGDVWLNSSACLKGVVIWFMIESSHPLKGLRITLLFVLSHFRFRVSAVFIKIFIVFHWSLWNFSSFSNKVAIFFKNSFHFKKLPRHSPRKLLHNCILHQFQTQQRNKSSISRRLPITPKWNFNEFRQQSRRIFPSESLDRYKAEQEMIE
jgi:hypothetical protein